MPDQDASQARQFHTQGPLPPDAEHLYVVREADETISKLINRRDYVALIGPRLSGKSSMLLRQWARLKNSPLHVPVYISLGPMAGLAEAQWNGQVHRQIAQQSGGLLATPPDPAPHALALQEEINDAMEGPLKGKVLVILVDQIESTPEAFSTAFFATLREMFTNRWMRPVLQNVVFVLAGRFVPDELIKDPAISPFRVTETVYVGDATLEALTKLVACLATEERQISSDVPARIFEWTEGDVYLSHKLCAGLARDVPEGAILLPDVDRAARRHLYEDEIFRKMWKHVQEDPEISQLVQTLLEHREQVRFTLLQRHIMVAWLEGAIKADASGNCVLHSLVHESVFYGLLRTRSGPAGKTRRQHAMNLHQDKTVLLERFRLEQVLHPGLTSYVYKATDLETEQPVAIKQLMVSRELNEMAWLRFQRESDALRRLEHPHIVKLIDAFRDGDFEYIVMEYVYGGSLFDKLNREGRLPLRRALKILMQVASALAHAHSREIIHRDIKPSNTMLTHDLSPRLADFGVARLNYHQRMTLPHTVIGTTPYLSPEGVLGETLDARGDVWALGVMLFEMLAGTLPFIGRTDDMIAQAILDQDVPELQKIRPEVTDAVIALIQKMLNKSLTYRMATAQEVHDALKAILQALPPDESKKKAGGTG
ncbi:MAG: serine/threonine protein kinase [Anaerolineae bacterium]|nr:serine/threonine protein kinase [Anaerolineae bacterium]